MRSHLRYLRTVLRHKWYVYRYGRELGVPRTWLLVHDLSKFSRAEWGPYVARFASGRAGKEDKSFDSGAFAGAWRHHWQSNPHHWEFWSSENIAHQDSRRVWRLFHQYTPSINGTRVIHWDASKEVYAMPELFVREMVADWQAASKAYTGKDDCLEWYAATKDKQVMHQDTRRRVEELLGLR